MNALLRVRSAYGRLLLLCGWIAGLITFATMCLIVGNVVSRYAVGVPIAGTLELTEGALPLIIFLALALTQHDGGHIRVTLVTDRLPQPVARVLAVIAMLAGVVLFSWAAWAGWLAANRSFAIGEMERGSIRFPLWPIKYAVCFGMILLSVQFLIDAVCVAAGMKPQEINPEEVE